MTWLVERSPSFKSGNTSIHSWSTLTLSCWFTEGYMEKLASSHEALFFVVVVSPCKYPLDIHGHLLRRYDWTTKTNQQKSPNLRRYDWMPRRDPMWTAISKFLILTNILQNCEGLPTSVFFFGVRRELTEDTTAHKNQECWSCHENRMCQLFFHQQLRVLGTCEVSSTVVFPKNPQNMYASTFQGVPTEP